MAAMAGVVGGLLTGCAYYNTFYFAKRYYARSLEDVPYAVDKTDVSDTPQFPRAIDLSKKLIEQYPKSKWVDDAYVLWAKSLIGTEDPREAAKMLEVFSTRYPKSSENEEARFYLGVAYARAHKYERAVAVFDTFLTSHPSKKLVPYAHFERARVLLALDRPHEAVQSVTVVIEKHSKSPVARRAREVRAQALLAEKQYDRARDDYRQLGRTAPDDDTRLVYLLNESECLEGGQKYSEALSLLHDALAHEREPLPPDTTQGRQIMAPTGPGADHYGRLLTRIGTVLVRSGQIDQGLQAYRRVVLVYPHSAVGAEAQYRIGYAYETAADDFENARIEYARVKDQGPGTAFADQAANRVTSLDRLAQYRAASGDTIQHQADAAFLLAEQYLFDLDKPERALEEYRRIEESFAGTPYAAKAINGQAWVLSRKLDHKPAADSLFWRVVREYPGTEAQLAARDYLAYSGIEVPSDLIKLPEPPPVDTTAVDTTLHLTQPPEGTIPLGTVPTLTLSPDASRIGLRAAPFTIPPIIPKSLPPDTTHVTSPPHVSTPHSAAPDTTRRVTPSGAVPGPSPPPDTSPHVPGTGSVPVAPSPVDTTRHR